MWIYIYIYICRYAYSYLSIHVLYIYIYTYVYMYIYQLISRRMSQLRCRGIQRFTKGAPWHSVRRESWRSLAVAAVGAGSGKI